MDKQLLIQFRNFIDTLLQDDTPSEAEKVMQATAQEQDLFPPTEEATTDPEASGKKNFPRFQPNDIHISLPKCCIAFSRTFTEQLQTYTHATFFYSEEAGGSIIVFNNFGAGLAIAFENGYARIYSKQTAQSVARSLCVNYPYIVAAAGILAKDDNMAIIGIASKE